AGVSLSSCWIPGCSCRRRRRSSSILALRSPVCHPRACKTACFLSLRPLLHARSLLLLGALCPSVFPPLSCFREVPSIHPCLHSLQPGHHRLCAAHMLPRQCARACFVNVQRRRTAWIYCSKKQKMAW